MRDTKGKKVLLYSGGVDSWLISKIAKPDIKLYFDIGTPSCKGEMKRLDKDVIIDHSFNFGNVEDQKTFIVPLRNAYFILKAAEYGDHIILGTNKTDAHNDKIPRFADDCMQMLNHYYTSDNDGLSPDRDLFVDFSYKNYTRADLCKLYLDQGGTVEEALSESFSCYTPTEDDKECHNCRPCYRKMMGFFVNGCQFPKGYLASFIPYLEKNIVANNYEDKYYSIEQCKAVVKAAYKDKEEMECNN